MFLHLNTKCDIDTPSVTGFINRSQETGHPVTGIDWLCNDTAYISDVTDHGMRMVMSKGWERRRKNAVVVYLKELGLTWREEAHKRHQSD
jgi:hypothetical protein